MHSENLCALNRAARSESPARHSTLKICYCLNSQKPVELTRGLDWVSTGRTEQKDTTAVRHHSFKHGSRAQVPPHTHFDKHSIVGEAKARA